MLFLYIVGYSCCNNICIPFYSENLKHVCHKLDAEVFKIALNIIGQQHFVHCICN